MLGARLRPWLDWFPDLGALQCVIVFAVLEFFLNPLTDNQAPAHRIDREVTIIKEPMRITA